MFCGNCDDYFLWNWSSKCLLHFKFKKNVLFTEHLLILSSSSTANSAQFLLCVKWIIFSKFSEYLDTITSKGGHSRLWISSHIRLNVTHKWYHKSNCCVALMTRQQYNRFVNCALLAVDKDRIRRINQDTLHIHNACCHCSLRYLLSLRVSSQLHCKSYC